MTYPYLFILLDIFYFPCQVKKKVLLEFLLDLYSHSILTILYLISMFNFLSRNMPHLLIYLNFVSLIVFNRAVFFILDTEIFIKIFLGNLLFGRNK